MKPKKAKKRASAAKKCASAARDPKKGSRAASVALTTAKDPGDAEGDCYLVTVSMLVFGFRNVREVDQEIHDAIDIPFFDHDDLEIEIIPDPP